MDYASMSAEELTAENLRLSGEKDAIRREMLLINQELTHRAAEEKAMALVASMNEDEKAAVAQAIGVVGIDATSQVGTPGAEG